MAFTTAFAISWYSPRHRLDLSYSLESRAVHWPVQSSDGSCASDRITYPMQSLWPFHTTTSQPQHHMQTDAATWLVKDELLTMSTGVMLGERGKGC
jgi:hypothetical protein